MCKDLDLILNMKKKHFFLKSPRFSFLNQEIVEKYQNLSGEKEFKLQIFSYFGDSNIFSFCELVHMRGLGQALILWKRKKNE